ncbi:MAG: VWA domain-containing protein [Candidatus Schekmanbacteria bacterium]|nr:VWA domain-containing protein [Candidatus Schekmanbacteria bacterium]
MRALSTADEASRRLWVAIGVMASVAVGCWSWLAIAHARIADQAVNVRLALDRSVLPAGSGNRAVLKVTLDGVAPTVTDQRPPVHLSVAIDRSGSMSGDKLAKAKEAAIEAVRMLSAGDLVSIITYDNTAQVLIDNAPASAQLDIEGAIRDLQTGGGTALFAGVAQAAGALRQHLDAQAVQRVILLSDGQANVGPSSPAELALLGTSLRKEGMAVTTIGLGLDYNEDLMAALAQASDGNTYFVEQSRNLAGFFASELGDVLKVVAQKVDVRVTFPDGARPLAILGRDGRISGQTVELALNQIYGGQAKYALIEVDIAGRAAGEQMQVAAAEVSYDNPVAKRRQTQSATASARFSSAPAEVASSADKEVLREHGLVLSSIAEQQAVALADEGKLNEAVMTLEESAHQLDELGRSLGEEELSAKAKGAAADAKAIKEEGLSNRDRKRLKTVSQQVLNQQNVAN